MPGGQDVQGQARLVINYLLFVKIYYGEMELGNEIACKWICLKISRMVGSDIQRLAGGPGPLRKNRSQEQCQAHLDNI